MCVKMYSTGSSTVRMWPVRLALRWSIIAASVVDLPEPVAPATSTMPRLSMTRLSSTGGSFSSSNDGMTLRTKRIAMAMVPRWRKMLIRKLPTSRSRYERFISSWDSNAAAWSLDISS